jgi:AbrB family looped-hinge helix DNA binding protein
LTASSNLLLFKWRVESLNRSTATALVSVNSKHQVVIPQTVREKIGLNVGDLLEAKAEHGKITLTPKPAADRGIAESLADFREGRTYGPFETHEELVRSLHDQTAELRSKRRSRKARRT